MLYSALLLRNSRQATIIRKPGCVLMSPCSCFNSNPALRTGTAAAQLRNPRSGLADVSLHQCGGLPGIGMAKRFRWVGRADVYGKLELVLSGSRVCAGRVPHGGLLLRNLPEIAVSKNCIQVIHHCYASESLQLPKTQPRPSTHHTQHLHTLTRTSELQQAYGSIPAKKCKMERLMLCKILETAQVSHGARLKYPTMESSQLHGFLHDHEPQPTTAPLFRRVPRYTDVCIYTSI